MTVASISDLVAEYDRALAFTSDLCRDLTADEIVWRAGSESSAIGWHLGHQAAVAHFLVRNLTAAEPSPDPGLDALMDSATPEHDRGDLPDPARILAYRAEVAERVKFRIANIDEGKVGTPNQLRVIAQTLLVAVINHEYQHDKWIGELRADVHGKALPDTPTSPLLGELDGYLVITP